MTTTDPVATRDAIQPVIRPLDLADDDAMRRAYDATSRAVRHGREAMPHWSFAEFLGAMRSPDSGEKMLAFTAHLDESSEEVVGGAVLFVFLLDNLDKAWLEVQVDPAYRGRGIGSALLDHLTALAVAEGRTELLADAKLPSDQVADHPYRRFAERHGFVHSNVEVVRHAPLPVPTEQLDAWAARAAAKAGPYEIRTLVNEVPEDLATSLGVLLGQLGVDAPTGTVDFEEEKIGPERVRERTEAVRAMGRDLYETVALAEDGTVVAQTTLVAPTDGSTSAWQWGTFVHREHRGHSLGLAVKAANLRALQQAHPELRRVTTQNAETNDWMIAINVEMGFEPVEVSAEFVKRLATG